LVLFAESNASTGRFMSNKKAIAWGAVQIAAVILF